MRKEFPITEELLNECQKGDQLIAAREALETLKNNFGWVKTSYWYGYLIGCLETACDLELMSTEEFSAALDEIFERESDKNGN